MEAVHGLHQQGLVPTGTPVQRVQRDAAVEPARRVPRVDRVRQRRHQVLTNTCVLAREPDGARAEVIREVARREATDQVLREPVVVETLQERARSFDEPEADLVLYNLAV